MAAQAQLPHQGQLRALASHGIVEALVNPLGQSVGLDQLALLNHVNHHVNQINPLGHVDALGGIGSMNQAGLGSVAGMGIGNLANAQGNLAGIGVPAQHTVGLSSAVM
jgi:hypothetical protein